MIVGGILFSVENCMVVVDEVEMVLDGWFGYFDGVLYVGICFFVSNVRRVE